jgi:uroporphyrinogen-III synthase
MDAQALPGPTLAVAVDISVGKALAGRHIVVTRPAGQATHLAEALVAHGAKPVLFPVLAIVDVADRKPLLDLALRLDQFDIAVFISPNAVRKALDVILEHRSWPDSLRVATMGKSSENELARYAIGEVGDIISPQDRFDSEALLALPAMQDVAGKRIVIFRGDGGRELLGDTLLERGASVEYAECYRRGKPDLDAAPLLKLWEADALDAITITSSEGLRNLFDMIGPLGQAWLRKTPLFVPHPRIAAQAEALGLKRVIPTDAADDGLVSGLLAYFASESEHRD